MNPQVDILFEDYLALAEKNVDHPHLAEIEEALREIGYRISIPEEDTQVLPRPERAPYNLLSVTILLTGPGETIVQEVRERTIRVPLEYRRDGIIASASEESAFDAFTSSEPTTPAHIAQLFGKYLRIVSNDADAPELKVIEQQLSEDGYSIFVPENSMRTVTNNPEVPYEIGSATFTLLDPSGMIIVETMNHHIKIHRDRDVMDENSDSTLFDDDDTHWLEKNGMSFSNSDV